MLGQEEYWEFVSSFLVSFVIGNWEDTKIRLYIGKYLFILPRCSGFYLAIKQHFKVN